MKRVWILLLALMLCGAAFGETREGVVYIEGEAEPVVETLFRASAGFTFWYDAEALEAAEVYDGAEVHVWPKGNDAVMLSLIPSRFAGEGPAQWLALNAQGDVEIEEDETEGGDGFRWFSMISPYNASKLWSYYAVEGADDFVVAEGIWPLEVDEGWGTRLRAVLRTVSFGAPDAQAGCDSVTVERWEDADIDADRCETFYADESEDAVGVVLTPTKPLKDFSLVALTLDSFGFDGDVRFGEEVLATWPEVKPGYHLVVAMAFYGDIPNNGIRFTDPETGIRRLYAVDLSGEDGSLQLTPVDQDDP